MRVAEAALVWQQAGVSVIPIMHGGQKRPAFRWSPYQVSLPTSQMVQEWWGGDTEYGLALICGGVSGNLEMCEIEGRVFARPGALLDIVNHMDEMGAGPVWDLLTGPEGYAEDSPSGGMHLLYRIVDNPVPGNVKIARRPATAAELELDPTNKLMVLAETRGQGGYVVVAPTTGACHKSGEPWRLVNGNYGKLPEITWAQRNLLHEALRVALDEMPVVEATIHDPLPAVIPAILPRSAALAVSPGDDFEARTPWDRILGPHGWHKTMELTGGETHWTRPGKDVRDGISATTGRANDRDRLYVFSTSTVFEAEVPYTKFGAFALLNHGGDHTRAARQLAALGFGSRRAIETVELGDFSPASTESSEPNIDTSKNYTLDDVGNASRLVDRVRGRFRYIWEEKTWYQYHEGSWKRDTNGALAREWIAITEEMRAEADRDDFQPLRAWTSKSRQAGKVTAAMSVAQCMGMTYSAAEWAPERHLVNVLNGVLDLKTSQLAKHDSRHLITHNLGTSFDPNATCPNFDQFMAEAVPSPEMRSYVQRALGYSLLGDADQRSIFLIHGPSGTGKSTLIETMREVFGDYGTTAGPGAFRSASSQGGPTADLHALRGRRFVTTSETSDSVSFDEDLLKRISGRDRVTSRSLYQEPVEWTPECTLWIATNNPPKFNSDDDAIWRRTKLIPFTTVFRGKGEVADFARRMLFPELPGILNWLLVGLQGFLAHGLGEPDEVQHMAASQRHESDSVARFVEDALSEDKLVLGQGLAIPASTLFLLYVEWSRTVGERGVGSRRFNLRLASNYPTLVRNETSWLGIGRRSWAPAALLQLLPDPGPQ